MDRTGAIRQTARRFSPAVPELLEKAECARWHNRVKIAAGHCCSSSANARKCVPARLLSICSSATALSRVGQPDGKVRQLAQRFRDRSVISAPSAPSAFQPSNAM
jgi:hypothetical protein